MGCLTSRRYSSDGIQPLRFTVSYTVYQTILLSYVGSEICGLDGSVNEELCARWHQFGSFLSLMFVTGSPATNRDPGTSPVVGNATKSALQFRYKYMPYLYT